MKRPFGIFFKVDAFSVFLLGLLLILTVLSAMFKSLWLVLFGLIVAAYSLFRVISGSLSARKRENDIFLAVIFAPVRLARHLFRKLFPDKTHIFVRCPVCTANLRLKKVAGDHTVRCPSCATRFPVHMD